jgi:hypothetical protein
MMILFIACEYSLGIKKENLFFKSFSDLEDYNNNNKNIK